MSNHSDGEDSQMHDNGSLPSSTPSTPPASSHHTHGTALPTSPPDSQPQMHIPNPQQQQHHQQQQQQETGRVGASLLREQPGQQLQGQPSWAGKRAVEEADNARERCVDKGFRMSWVGDPFDESDMWKV